MNENYHTTIIISEYYEIKKEGNNRKMFYNHDILLSIIKKE